jgi:1-acyl-sn-glycerol-3-phosphate acyltransferase
MDQATFVAIVAALAMAASLAGWAFWAWWRSRYTLFQAVLCFMNYLVARILWRTEISGPLPVAPDEGALIICNHTSGVDPNVIQLCTDRVVHWMVAREYYEMPILSRAFKATDTIPVNRAGVDTAATKMAIRLAQRGGLVGLFPEGRINMTKDLLLPGRPGAALIALKAKVKVIPCYVTGVPYDGTALGSLFMPGKARVTVGQPIDLSPYFGRDGDKTVLQELTKRFLVEIAKLAGVPDYEPQLAGRNWKTGSVESEAGDGEINRLASSDLR